MGKGLASLENLCLSHLLHRWGLRASEPLNCCSSQTWWGMRVRDSMKFWLSPSTSPTWTSAGHSSPISYCRGAQHSLKVLLGVGGGKATGPGCLAPQSTLWSQPCAVSITCLVVVSELSCLIVDAFSLLHCQAGGLTPVISKAGRS